MKNNNHGCNCCMGDEPIYWDNKDNNAFVDKKGNILITAKGNEVSFKVKYCPNCGKYLHQDEIWLSMEKLYVW